MKKRRSPFFSAPKANFRGRLTIAGGIVAAVAGGVAVGVYLSDLLYHLP